MKENPLVSRNFTKSASVVKQCWVNDSQQLVQRLVFVVRRISPSTMFRLWRVAFANYVFGELLSARVATLFAKALSK